jgi:uncharacterized membrane protein
VPQPVPQSVPQPVSRPVPQSVSATIVPQPVPQPIPQPVPQPVQQQRPVAPPPVYTSQPQTSYQQPMNDTRLQPLGVGSYIGMFLLMAIPLVNIILLIVWAVSSDVNKNKKNFAIASIILGIIMTIIGFLLSGVIIALITAMSGSFQTY